MIGGRGRGRGRRTESSGGAREKNGTEDIWTRRDRDKVGEREREREEDGIEYNEYTFISSIL